MRIRGRWEGKLLDASGVDALVALDLDGEGDDVKGEFSAGFLPERRDACGGEYGPLQTVGAVHGRVTEDGRLQLRSEMDVAGEPVVVTFDAGSGDPDPHARAAFYGTFAVEEGYRTLTLQGGTVVLWRYAAARREEQYDDAVRDEQDQQREAS